MWVVLNSELVLLLENHIGSVTSVAFSPSGE